MKAAQVIGPNDDSGFWDVPESEMMVHRYRACSRLVYEVIEPSNTIGPHNTILFLWDGKTRKCYGTVSTTRTLHDPSYSDHDRVLRVMDLMDRCYRIIADVIGWDVLLDTGNLRHDMGRFNKWDAIPVITGPDELQGGAD